MTSTTLTPVTASERIDNLDVLRGLALLGIALMNVEYFTAPLMDMSEGISPDARGLDWLADAFVYTFVQGKFWTLFSLLFGMGFAVMLGRAQAAGRRFMPMYLRRTSVLLVFGLVHALLVWAGDILVSYAVSALVLLLFFRDTDTPRLWKWGTWIWGVMIGLMLLGATAMLALGDAAQDPSAAANAATVETLRALEVEAYSGGTYAEANTVRWRYFVHALGNELFLVPVVLGMFLLGAWLVRSGAMARPAEHRRLFTRLVWVSGPVGLALTAASLAIEPNPAMGADAAPAAMMAMTLHMAAAPLLALTYVAVVVLALQRGAAWLLGFAPAGRMALTNYLSQSVIGTLVFYGYGFGLWGEVSRAWQVLGVVAVFALQLVLSRWWLARFRFGPLEWAWRAVTYWQWPPMCRVATPVPAAVA